MPTGAEIKRLRGDSISQAEAARRLGVPSGRLQKWEERDRDPKAADAAAICAYFGVKKLEDLSALNDFPDRPKTIVAYSEEPRSALSAGYLNEPERASAGSPEDFQYRARYYEQLERTNTILQTDMRRALDTAQEATKAALTLVQTTAQGLQQAQMSAQKAQEDCAVLSNKLKGLSALRQNDIHYLTTWLAKLMQTDQETLLADMRTGSKAAPPQS